MENKKIIERLKQHRAEIIDTLSANNWRHFKDYFLIKEKYLSNNIENSLKHIIPFWDYTIIGYILRIVWSSQFLPKIIRKS